MTETRADMLISAFWPMVKAGFAVSLPLAIASFVIGMIIAVAVALVRIMPSGGIFQKCLLKLVEFYISVIRGTPLLAAVGHRILWFAFRRHLYRPDSCRHHRLLAQCRRIRFRNHTRGNLVRT